MFSRVWKAFNAVRIIQSENRRAREKLIGWENKLSCFICVADVVFRYFIVSFCTQILNIDACLHNYLLCFSTN